MTNDSRALQLINELGIPNGPKVVEARRTLRKMGKGVVKPLIAALKNPNEKLRMEVVQILGDTGDGQAALALLDTINNDGVLNVQVVAVNSLNGLVTMPGVMETLISLAADESRPILRERAIGVLYSQKKMDADFWLALLNDSVEMTVVMAIGVLSQKNDFRVADAFRKALDKWAGNDNVIYNIFDNWKKMSQKLTVEDVAPYLQSIDHITRGRAAEIMGQVGNKRVIPLLETLLDDKAKVFQIDNYGPYETVGGLAKKSIYQIQNGKKADSTVRFRRTQNAKSPLMKLWLFIKWLLFI